MYIPTINFSLLFTSIPFVLSGLKYTLFISCVSFIGGNILALCLVSLRLLSFPIIERLIRVYLSFLRGVPALVLLFILYFGLPYQLSALTATIVCFVLTSSAFIAEVYRGALESVPQGQWDAAAAQGFTKLQIFRYVVFPQAWRVSIPSLGNVAIDLVKGTALAAMITVPEIFHKAKIVGGRTFDYMTMYVLVACIYWFLCLAISWGQKHLEQSLKMHVE